MYDKSEAVIRKDTWCPSRPWVIDLYWNDGKHWKSWGYNFKTKKDAVWHCKATGVKIKET